VLYTEFLLRNHGKFLSLPPGPNGMIKNSGEICFRASQFPLIVQKDLSLGRCVGKCGGCNCCVGGRELWEKVIDEGNFGEGHPEEDGPFSKEVNP
jgi:hypothetical protein